MKKLIALLFAGALSLGTAAVLHPASANDCPPQDTDPSDQSISVQTDAGGLCAEGDPGTQTGHVWADGNEGNPGPSSGYISLDDQNGLCADDNGGPAEGGDSPTCQATP